MNEVQIFNSEQFGSVRTIEDENKVLFCGSDVAKALRYTNPSKALNDHCRYITKRYIPHPQSEDKTIEMTFIPESDIYRLITHSKLPTAEKFEQWIFDEVLPTIRKTGGYVANDSLFVETYLPFADENTKTLFRLTLDTVRQLNRIIEKQSKQIEEEKPLVEFAEHVTDSTNAIDVSELAKIANKEHINIGRNRLMQWLRDNGYIMSNQGHKNQPYQQYINLGLFKVVEYTYKTPYGMQTGFKTLVTGKSQVYFIEKLRKLFSTRTTATA